MSVEPLRRCAACGDTEYGHLPGCTEPRTHDPMCPTFGQPTCLQASLPNYDCDTYGHLPPCGEFNCLCHLIARVRQDEHDSYCGSTAFGGCGCYESGAYEERDRIRTAVLDHYRVAPKAAEPMLRIIDKETTDGNTE